MLADPQQDPGWTTRRTRRTSFGMELLLRTLATAACGGDVGPSNPSSEYAFSRGIRCTDDGRAHALLLGRPVTWDAPAIHADVVKAPPPGSVVLASNDIVPVQALAIANGSGTFWGTQYHPELDLSVLATMLASSADEIVKTGQAPDKAAVEDYARQISSVGTDAGNAALAAELGIGPDLTTDRSRRIEVRNYLGLLQAGRGA